MRRFAQVDVFTARPGRGNPVAVVLDAEGLPDEEMQRLAHWTNLSETTFVLPPTRPEADYRVRIFTPDRELPFAGHPTIGTCQALWDDGQLGPGPSWVQECAAGPVEVRRLDDGALAFAAPAPVLVEPLADEELLARALGGVRPHRPTLIGIGPVWLTGRVTPAELDALDLDAAAFRELAEVTPDVTLYAVDQAGDLHVRSFFRVDGGIAEDPVCGSGNACVARHVQLTAPDARLDGGYRAFQGRHRGRDGRITVELGERNWIGGRAVTVVSGTIAV
ncbi:PhzF family phenazine biosynthesis protein [Kineosporia sp. J2-2]|uniref:PhzF family phenazine biosynthesis protein n=1 Tax=Kineosporia corallincola TaxID=2835133 RepID=A0ABS5TMD0_9ACTN|nr:PhzF family phenazine biosynthesis protein [Kineosporia corallincola]MBT0772265.1 PhzF family phenazine biosynthesis protein [Kineosporia corallincola]